MVLSYITARTAMNRLDEVLGPENWEDSFSETKDGLTCRITITLPNGDKVTKQDGGGFADMTAEDDTEKSTFSDAFKRAAVKFGVGRYLYRDGVPDFVSLRPRSNPQPNSSVDVPDGVTEDEALDRIHDQIVDPSDSREPGCDDIPETDGDSKKDGRWLFPRTERRGHTAWYQAFGREHAFPDMIVQWSPKMVSMAIAARKKVVI